MKKDGEFMDKLKTKVLILSLIMISLISISSIVAADINDTLSENHEGFNLSEETANDVPQSGDSKVLSSASSKDQLKANDDGSSNVTVIFHKKCSDGDVTDSISNKISSGGSWGVGMAKFKNQVANKKYSDFKYQGEHYVFSHWEDADGNTVTDTQRFYATGEDYEAHFYAIYDHSPIGSLTVNYIDNIAHGSGGMNYTEYGTNYKHTFKTPADIPDGAVFLYWENENGTRYNAGDTLEIKSSEFEGINKVVNVYAVYDIKTSIELEEITGYVGDVVDITAKINENLKDSAVPGGTATLTIDFDNKLSNGALGAGTYTQTVDVVDGQAVFKDVKLEDPGTYSYKVEYSGYHYNQHSEGINDYLPSQEESKLHILPLNTTTTSDDVSGTAGDTKDITADIIDQNGEPVQNGTAVLKVNGKEYKAEVENGKAVFKDVELPSESTEATIDYLGNDYYNPSNTTIQITVTQPEEPDEEPEEPSEDPKDPEEPTDEPKEPSEEPKEPKNESKEPSVPKKTTPKIPTGNPIVLAVLGLLVIVSTVSLRRK